MVNALRIPWKYEIDGERLGPIAQEDLIVAINAGQILPNTPVWRPGMDSWQSAASTELAKYFSETGAPSEAAAKLTKVILQRDRAKSAPPPPGKTRSVSGFRNWLQISLAFFVVTNGLTILTNLNAIKFLADFQNGNLIGDFNEGAARVDLISGGVSILYLVALLLCAIAYCRFFHRVQTNLQSLHVASATSSPTQTWVWNFVPIANLWKPVDVFNEVQRAAHETAGAPPISAGLIAVWWGAWLFANILATFSGTFQDSPSALINGFYISSVSNALLIVAAVLLYRFVKRIGIFHEGSLLMGKASVFD